MLNFWVFSGILVIVLIALLFWKIGRVADDEGAHSREHFTFAFLALNDNKLCTEAELVTALKSRTSAKIETESDSDPEDPHAKAFTVDGHLVAVGLMDYPIPWRDLEGPCATSWMWRDASDIMRKHRAHLLVSVMDTDGATLDRVRLLTDLMVACIETNNAAGVYWGAGTVVHSPEFFVQRATCETDALLPVELWIDIRIQRNADDSVNFITTGMEQFGCMEIEILESKSDIDALLPMVTGLAHIMIHGDKIADGDTIGHDDETKIKTTHEDSVWDRPGKVLRIHL